MKRKRKWIPRTGWERNQFGIMVKKCCLTCPFWDETRSKRVRICMKQQRTVTRYHICEHWEMSEGYQMAGNGDGKVKRWEYLQYLLKIREEESLAEQNGLRIKVKTVEEIRTEFESQYGSIYLLV